MGFLKQLVLLATAVNLADITDSSCLSTQYIEKGTTTLLACVFSTTFECVVWYKTPGEGPLITLEKGKRSGPGYTSGEYDISLTGRLQINNVSLEHDRFFRVVVLYHREWENDVREDIRVHVYVKPLQTFPKIDICGDESYCLTKIDKQIELSCSVIQSRPAVRLQWLEISGEERDLESRTDIQQFDHTSSSVAVATVSLAEGNLLEVILCRAVVTAPVLEKNEALVLLEGTIEAIPWGEFDSQLIEIHDQVLLDIQLDDVYAVVWKKLSSLTYEYETIGHYAHGKSTSLKPDLLIKDDGSLQIRKLLLQHEGEYICIYARPLEQDIRKFVLEVFIPPSPPFTTIYGCTERENCQMDVAETGSLTCTLKGIRPVVHVEWFYPGPGYPPIRFINPKTSIIRRGAISDITVTTYFEIVQQRFSGDFSISCRALGLSQKYPQMSSSLTLHSVPGISSVQNEIGDTHERSVSLQFSIVSNVITGVLLIGLIVVVVVIVIWLRKDRRRRGQHDTAQEGQKSASQADDSGNHASSNTERGSASQADDSGNHASSNTDQGSASQADGSGNRASSNTDQGSNEKREEQTEGTVTNEDRRYEEIQQSSSQTDKADNEQDKEKSTESEEDASEKSAMIDKNKEHE